MIETYATTDALADVAAHAVSAQLSEALRTHGRAGLVATGGRSPGPIYDRLADMPLAWNRVIVTLSDERCVPPDDPASNARLVRERLLQRNARRAHFLPLWPEPEAAALAAVQPCDVVMLGMGEDGHVASLFPGGPEEAHGLAVGIPAGAPQPRISLTLHALEPRRLTVLLISGEAKRRVLEEGSGLPVHALLARTAAPVRVLWSP